MQAADTFSEFVQPLLANHCTQCHGDKGKVKGKVNLAEIATGKEFLARPELIKEMIEVIDAGDMPPEDEPPLDTAQRTRMLATLKSLLADATRDSIRKRTGMRRLNRFQYNNSVKDLFKLRRDVFALPEKLMTRQSNFLTGARTKMPDRVEVTSMTLIPQPGLAQVRAFPKDLRAAHGFDNQANQLTLSPLLLDAFLKLSVSILESPDFTPANVGIWNTFFLAPPEGADQKAEIRKRLEPFMLQAFRHPVEPKVLERYTVYAVGKVKHGLTFPDAMKKAASAILSSPLFLYRYAPQDDAGKAYALASDLSYFLWASGPDAKLLELAGNGELAQPEVLAKTLKRMLSDPRIERFLDTFPSQWMQLENLLAATPDPKQHKYFSLDKAPPASLQMLLEPLLLFDTVFVEDRPVIDLVAPDFAYQSELLRTWYAEGPLRAPRPDTANLEADNRANNQKRKELEARIKQARADLDNLLNPIRARLVEERENDVLGEKPVDLMPYAAWEFDGNLKSSNTLLDLKAHGKVQFQDGMVVLDRTYLQSKNLPIELKAKSLEVWCKVPDINQQGGGLMGIQGPGDFFDTIVLGERKHKHWISGSNGFARTQDFPESTPEQEPNQLIHLLMTYQPDGTTTLYRNGKPYGKPYRKNSATFPKNRTSVLFGLRHLPAGANKHLRVSIDKARLYTRALTAEEVASAFSGQDLYISELDLQLGMTEDQKERRQLLSRTITETEEALQKVPKPKDVRSIHQNAQKRYDDQMRNKLRSRTFQRVALDNPRYGGVITNAAMMSMTSGPKRTHPIARGAWIIEVILNDPPPPPPNDVPPLNEDAADKRLTIREKFAKHRENPDCAGCHSRLDPLGFAMENFDITGRWRDKYSNGREVDSAGTLLRRHPFTNPVEFKAALLKEERRFAKAFTAHLLRFALSRELAPADTLVIDSILHNTQPDQYRLRSLLREVVLSKSFLRTQ